MNCKKLSIFLLLLLVAFSSCKNKERFERAELAEFLDSIVEKGIADQRTELYEVEVLEKNGLLSVIGKTTSEWVFEEIQRLSQTSRGGVITNNVRLVPDEVVGDLRFGLCNVSVGNLRKTPKHSAELTSQILLGHPVRILDKKEGWLQIQTAERYIGWIDEGAIQIGDFSQIQKWDNANKVLMSAPFIRTKGLEADDVVSDLVQGNVLILKDSLDGNLVKVQYPDEREALVQGANVVPFKRGLSLESIDLESIVVDAQRFLGTPYLWGGTSIKGVDCSGFTKSVYFLHGLILQRDASQQARDGQLVDLEGDFEKLLPGDLMFFGERLNDREKVVHVGMYLDNGKFIHASGDGQVKINSVYPNAFNYSEKETKRYLYSRRYVGQDTLYYNLTSSQMYKSIGYE